MVDINIQEAIQIILQHGYTLERIAVETDSSWATVYRWSVGKTRPRKNGVQKKIRELLDKCKSDAIL